MAGPDILVDYDPDRMILRCGVATQPTSVSARQYLKSLSGQSEEFDIFSEGDSEPRIRAARELVDGGEVRVVLWAAGRGDAAALERIAGRIRAALPDWPPADTAYSAASVLDGGFFYGQRVGALYRVEAVLDGHPARFNEQVLLLGRYCSAKYDPEGALVYLVTSRRETGLGIVRSDTPLADLLETEGSTVRVRPEFTPARCSEVVMADNPDLNVRLRWSGPQFSLRVRAPRVGAVLIMQDLLAAWRATLQRADHPLVQGFGFGDLRTQLGF